MHSVRRAPEPIPYPPQGEVIGALDAPDGRWRVEAIRRGEQQFYRLIHAVNVIGGLVIATVERLLAGAGVDLADLLDAPPSLNTCRPHPNVASD